MPLAMQNVAILSDLVAAQSFAAQSECLRALKNEIIGHALKKEKWVELGILRPIVRVLLPGRPAGWSDGASTASALRSETLNQEETAHLQALEVLGAFASGGPAFLPPLQAAGAVPAILAYIDPKATHHRLAQAALGAFVTLIKTSRLASAPNPASLPVSPLSLADAAFAPAHMHALGHAIAIEARSLWSDHIINTAVCIVRLLAATDARHQAALADAGILNALTFRVASCVVARGQVVPGAESVALREGLSDHIPQPATPRLDVAGVLEAIFAIVGDSRLRACMLLYSPSMLAIFPNLEFPVSRAVFGTEEPVALGALGALDYLLPAIPPHQPQAARAVHFTPSGLPASRAGPAGTGHNGSLAKRSGTTTARQRPGHAQTGASGASGVSARGMQGTATEDSGTATEDSGTGLSAEGSGKEVESPMVPWLLGLARSAVGLERVMAAAVLTSLFQSGFTMNASRESAMGLLVVAPLLRMLDVGPRKSGHLPAHVEANADRAEAAEQDIVEMAVTVLGRLFANNEVLQKAGAKAKATHILAKLLKASYDPVPLRVNPRPWNPTPSSSANPTRSNTPMAEAPGSSGGLSGPGGRRGHQDRATSVGDEDEMRDGSVDGDEAAGGSATAVYDDFDAPGMLLASSTMGEPGVSATLAYRVRLREAVLNALTALLATKYEYQREFVDLGVVPSIVASLSPAPSKQLLAGSGGAQAAADSKDRTAFLKDVEAAQKAAIKVDPEYGRNTNAVMIAACNCVRMLSRSIAIVRTTLHDARVAVPVLCLLQHPDIDVQIAAAGVVCNLVTETSPTRDRYVEAGIIDQLCTLTRSETPGLRVNSLWALKNIVVGYGPAIKKMCLEKLGADWLMSILEADPESKTSSVGVFGRAAAKGAGGGEDVEMDQGDWNADTSGASSLHRAKHPRTLHERSRTGRLRHAEARIATLRELESNAQDSSVWDNYDQQEQCLCIIRNMVVPYHTTSLAEANDTPQQGPSSGNAQRGRTPANAAASTMGIAEATRAEQTPLAMSPDTAGADMIDHLLSQVGQDRLFPMLVGKMRLQTAAQMGPSGLSGQFGAGEASRRQIVLHKITEAAVYILVHLSAGIPRHRQLLLSQTELLQSMCGHFGSRDRTIRLLLCHVVSNLASHDDPRVARQWVETLKNTGLGGQVARLRWDPEPAVRERVKMTMALLGLTEASANASAPAGPVGPAAPGQ